MAGIDRGAKMDAEVIVKDSKRDRSYHCAFIILVFILFIVAAALVGVLIYFLFIRNCSLEQRNSQENSTITGADETDTSYSSDEIIDDVDFLRLPPTVIPLHYNISITPYFYLEDIPADRERFTFDGRVRIVLQCIEETDYIFIHAKYLTITRLSVFNVQKNIDLIESYEEDIHNEVLNISLTETTLIGSTYILEAIYVGYILNDTYPATGFFQTSFKDESGTERWGGVTQMQPVWARQVLPCFDEPSLKAEFDVTIRHRADMTALSNGIELSTIELDGNMTGWKETVFKTTPKMSVYLLAFAVTHFVSMNKIISTGTMIRVWATPQKIQYAQYALDSAAKYTELFNELFDYEYHLEKQDMLASSKMFSAGMENWGLILYSEDAMLYNLEEHVVSRKHFVAMVVAHEIAHQWFGNLVTCKWWDDLWINEGLTEYWQYTAVADLEPGWDVPSMLLDDAFMFAMESDEPANSVPVRPDTRYIGEYPDYFSFAAYHKGASITRMLRNILGEDSFLLGIQQLLKRFSFDNVAANDLWSQLTEADADYGGHDVKTIMDNWITERYYPVVTLQRGQDNRTVNVSQRVFLTWAENEILRAEIGPILWHIPITYTYESRGSLGFQTPNRTWLYGEETGEFLLPYDIKPSDWYLANIGFYGYYRVNYDADNWNKLSQQLLSDHTVIPMANRYQLLNDAAVMFATNALDIQLLLDLTLYIDKETEYLPTFSATFIMGKMRNMLRMHPSYHLLQTYWLNKINSQYETHGWPSNNEEITPIAQKHQLMLIRETCKFGNEHCLQTVKEQYALLMANVSDIPIFKFPTILDVISCHAIAQGGAQEWDFAMEQIQSAEYNYEKEQWLYGLCCSKEPWRLRNLLHDLHTGNLRLDKYNTGFETAVEIMTFSEVGLRVAWEYVQSNFKDMVDDYNDYYYGTGSNDYDEEPGEQPEPVYIDDIVRDVSIYLTSELHLKQLLELRETYRTELATDMFSKAVLVVKDNVKKTAEYADRAGAWLEQHG